MTQIIRDFTKTEKDTVKRLESMMESCFCYGGVETDSWNFERYISEYKKELGEELFWVVYSNKKQDLKSNYEVLRLTGQDGEGNWYNTLKKVR